MTFRLHGVDGGRVYATDGRRVLVESPEGSHRVDGSPIRFERRGQLPRPGSATDRDRPPVRRRVETTRPWRTLLSSVVGPFPVVNLWPLGPTDLVATVGDGLYSSHDGGRSWQCRRLLPPSSGPMGTLPTGLCWTGDAVLLGEYPLATDTTPRVLLSTDRGRSWTVEAELPWARHVHGVHYDPYAGQVWVTTGDADAACRVGLLRDGSVEPVGGGSQRWRAVDLVFTPDAVLWGVDCAYADRNELLRLPRSALDRRGLDPEPTTVHAVDGSVYYGAAGTVDGERWVAFATAAETGVDRTAPGSERRSQSGRSGRPTAELVVSTSATGFERWATLGRFRKQPQPADVVPRGRLPTASGYLFVAADPTRGLLVNPYNLVASDGQLFAVDDDRLCGDGAERGGARAARPTRTGDD